MQENKVAILIGSSHGIGKATIMRLVEAGYITDVTINIDGGVLLSYMPYDLP